jgi:hypothetical protein
MLMCLQKGNVRANLENRVHGLVHTKCCEDLVAAASSSKTSSALNSGKQGRPISRSRSTTGNQRDLHSWFSSLSNADSRTVGKSPLGMHSNPIFSSLCWGFRKKIIEYAEKSYRVNSLHNDSKPGLLWMAEPNTTPKFAFQGENVL